MSAIRKAAAVALLFTLFAAAPLYAQEEDPQNQGTQEQEVTGQVTDASNGQVLPGASVLVKGTDIGATTGADGRYEVTVPDVSSDTLVFSYVGYELQEVAVAGRSQISVALNPASVEGEEIVVVGYGEQERVSVVGAIETVNAAEIEQSPVANVNAAMAGRLPGLTVTQTSGEPGREDFNLNIRGRSTTNTTQPLVLVDGVERPDYYSIDPNNIASISVLKDASATAVYGVRGANGVILIETKRGEAGERNISFRASSALKTFTSFPQITGAAEYARLTNLARTNNGLDPQYTEEEIAAYESGDQPLRYPNRNFPEEFLKDYSWQQNYNMTVSGGSDLARYFVSGGYIRQNGLFNTAEDDPKSPWDESTMLGRFNFRSNIDLELNESLSVLLNLAGNVGNQRNPVAADNVGPDQSSAEIIGRLTRIPPNAYARNLTPDGGVVFNPNVNGNPPYGIINRTGYNNQNSTRLQSTFGLDQEMDFIADGLSARLRFSFDNLAVSTQRRAATYARYRLETDGDSTYYLNYGTSEDSPLNVSEGTVSRKTSTLDLSLRYDQNFSEHDVSGLLLYNQIRRTINAEIPYNYLGFVGRVTYDYDNTYLAEVNFGYNGSEQFAPDNRFGFFPSFAVGWVPTNEDFLDDSKMLTYLKLRGSYGIVGNDQLGGQRFLYLADYASGQNSGGQRGAPILGDNYGGLQGDVFEQSLPNKNVQWERAHKFNLGIESGFYEDKLNLNIDLFYERRNNILALPNSTPTGYLGVENIPPVNYGVIQNMGGEATLSIKHSLRSDLYGRLRLNGEYNHNEYLDFDEPLLPADYTYRRRLEGFRIGQSFGLRSLGFFTSQEEIDNHARYELGGEQPRVGDLKYKDANEDGVIDEKDEVPIGYSNVPEITFSAQLSVAYKNFDLSVLMAGATNKSRYLGGVMAPEYRPRNFLERHTKSFTMERYEAGKEILYPRLSSSQNTNHRFNSFWQDDATYVRLKNFEIGYTLPSDLAEKVRAKSLRVYANGQNLLTWDRLETDSYDPQLTGGLAHPILRTFNVGVQMDF
jgi:TonB-linked SusC/RagA family outer membrane protein